MAMLRSAAVFLLLPGFLLSTSLAQQPAGSAFELAGIQVSGARRYTTAEVARVSRLEVGKPATVADVAAAAELMAGTGLFKSVNYRYTTAGRRITVTFEIEEADWSVPVVFDNFVWFPDDQVIAAVKQDVPSFDGTAPLSAGAPELIAGSLQKLLKAKAIPGRVDFIPQTVLKTAALTYVFSVKDPAPKVCAVKFTGASGVPDRELGSAVDQVVGNDYSRFYLTNVSNGTLLKMYRDRGYWRAAFAAPMATPGGAAGCAGVDVTLQVTEGMPYSWDRAEWKGNALISAETLEPLLDMKRRAIAGASKIDDGLRRVRKAYGKQGYLLQTASYVPRLEDAARTAVFVVTIDEGPQFRMGSVEFVGIPAADVESLKKKWRLQTDAVYDESYTDQFYVDELLPLQRRIAPQLRVVSGTRVDTGKRVVDVQYVFK